MEAPVQLLQNRRIRSLWRQDDPEEADAKLCRALVPSLMGKQSAFQKRGTGKRDLADDLLEVVLWFYEWDSKSGANIRGREVMSRPGYRDPECCLPVKYKQLKFSICIKDS